MVTFSFMFMPFTLKKLVEHIDFGACDNFFVPFVTLKPLKLESCLYLIWIPHKNSGPLFFSFPSYLSFWSYGPLIII